MRNYFYMHSQSTINEDFVIARRCLGLVHTYLVSPAYESVIFFNPLSRVEMFEYAMNPESFGR